MNKDQYKLTNEHISPNERSNNDCIYRIKALLKEQDFAVLSTQGQNNTYASLVAFVADENSKQIIFATPSYTRKFRLLSERDNVALLVDNRAEHSVMISDIEAITITGKARKITKADEITLFRELLLKKHQYLKELIASPSCTFFCVDVSRYFYVTHIQEVYQWVPT